MPKAEIISITTRRNALCVRGTTTVAELHGALVTACREQERVSAIGDALPQDTSPESEEYKIYSALMDAAGDAWWAAARQLPDAPARTPADLRLKADALRIVLEQCVCVEIGQTIDDIADAGEIEHVLAWSLARDVQNFAEAV